MTTLLTVYDSEGLLGRCDAKCYQALHPDCVCICGGSNHGKGRAAAIENTRMLAQDWLHHAAQSLQRARLHAQCQQDTLWGEL
jgi:hypothetical protein